VDILSLTEDLYFTSADWRAAGRVPNTLRKRVDRGATIEVRAGVYRDAGSSPHDFEDIITAFLSCKSAEAETPMAVFGAAAASLWGFPDLFDDRIDIGRDRREKRIRSDVRASSDIRLFTKQGWFGRPSRVVERFGVAVLRPEWAAVDLLERRIGDRDHVRQFLDYAERTGSITAGSLVSPLAELVVPKSPATGSLVTEESAIVVQLGAWENEPSGGPIRRQGFGTELAAPPDLGSVDAARLMDSTRGYWKLDKQKAAGRRWMVAARQGRTLAVYRIVSDPQPYGLRFWFEVVPETDDSIVDAFVGTEGRTFPPTRNPIRYWPPEAR
jgi:hypothetical protein